MSQPPDDRPMPDQVPAAPLRRLATGVPHLDTILGGGLVRGSSYIVQGQPGAGKTILANQISFARAAEGGRTLYLSLLAESFSQLFGFLRSLDFFDLSQVPDHIYYESIYSEARERGLESLVKQIRREVRERRPDIVVIDGLFAVSEAAGSDVSSHEFRRFVSALSALASRSDLSLVMLTNSARAADAPEYTMVDGWIELGDEFVQERVRRTLIVHKHRGGPVLRGKHEYRIDATGLSVFPRLEALASREPPEGAPTRRLPTGIEALDEIVHGGLPERSSTVILGPSGTGKTTIGLQYLAASTLEEKGLLFGFYESPDRLIEKAAGVGIDLRGLFERGILRAIWQAPYENLIDEVGQRIVDEVRTHGARRVVIDGINALRRPLVNAPRLQGFLRALNDLLKAEGATTIYTREVPQLFFPETLAVDELSGLIDNTVLLHYALDGNAVRRRLAVLKVRDSDFDHRSREFRIDGSGLNFDPPDDRWTLEGAATSGAVPRGGPGGGGPF